MKQLSEFSTYRTGILQARAYRNLRYFMMQTLQSEHLTSAEWTMLGVISDESKNGGIRVGHLADLLDVKTSFITNLVKKLISTGYIKHEYDDDDGRVRYLIATNSGQLKVIEIEQKMRKAMKDWLSDVDNTELVQYINVLQKISRKSAVK